MIRIWWIPQLGANIAPFYAEVETIAEGKRLYNTLANYDLYQFQVKVKPDYANMGGLEIKNEAGEWEEWTNEDGYTISELSLTEEEPPIEELSNQAIFLRRYGLKASKDIVEKCPDGMTIYDMEDKRYYTAKWHMPDTAFYIPDMARLIEFTEKLIP